MKKPNQKSVPPNHQAEPATTGVLTASASASAAPANPAIASGRKSPDTVFAQSELGIKLRNMLSLAATSKANRAVAEQLLRNPVRATTWGIEELAEHCGTSAPTLSRFAKHAGYEGFAQLRDAMGQVLQDMLQPMEKLRDAMEPDSKSSAVSQSLQAALNNCRQAAEGLDRAQVERISERLVFADTVYVMGFGISAHLAAMLALDVQPFCHQLINVVEFGGTEVAAGRLMNIKSRDVLIVMSFPRYARDAIRLTDYARERGAHVVVLTDSVASPLASLADELLLAPASHPVISSSSASAVVMIEALVTSLMVSRKQHVQQAGKLTEAIADYLITPTTKN
jgi:DNA-binding MurR/RpiR family transcriptional regulator